MFGAAALAFPAAAQTVVGGGGQPGVIVDYSVLDELGQPPNVPQVLMPGIHSSPPAARAAPQPRFPVVPGAGSDAGDGRITLTPPRETPPRSAARPAPQQPQVGTAPKAKPAPPQPVARAPATPPEPAPAPPAVSPPPPPAAITPPPVAAKPDAPAPQAPVEPPPAPAAPPDLPAAPPAAAPPPAPAPAAAPERPTEIARATPGPIPVSPGQSLRVGFDTGSARLGPDASEQLKRVAQGLAEDEELRIQLLAYAGGSAETASEARRLSLSRALAARSFLIGEGVRSTRIDVRALGNKSEGGPPDRIDVIVTKR